jgi:hypothetical protein
MLSPRYSLLHLLQFSLPFLAMALSLSGTGGGTGSPEIFFTAPKIERRGSKQSEYSIYQANTVCQEKKP